MKRIFSNGPSRDFVSKELTNLLANPGQVFIAAPYVTETSDVLAAAKRGVKVKLLVGLNATTSPDALKMLVGLSDVSIRYLTHRFHAKIYISESSVLLGSSNLTDGGMKSNREATIRLSHPGDEEAIEETRALFLELWESARVLTTETLSKFAEAHKRFKPSGAPDSLIEAAVGKAEPPNINVSSTEKSAERIFIEQLRREVYEQYRPAFLEVMNILQLHGFHRAELLDVGVANETNRFLSWVRQTYAPGDEWKVASSRTPEQRREAIVELGSAWTKTDQNRVPTEYKDWLLRVKARFGTHEAIESASKDELTAGMMSIHAFNEQYRFVKGGELNLPAEFWRANNGDVERVKRTLKYLVHGKEEFIERLHDVLYEPSLKLAYFGRFCALELYGTVKPEEFPPLNGRIAKALHYFGFDVHGD